MQLKQAEVICEVFRLYERLQCLYIHTHTHIRTRN